MGLVEFAKEELERSGFFRPDSDYAGMLGSAVMELIEKFSEQGHSGFSAHQTILLFHRLARWKPLSPITSDPSEWTNVSEYSPNQPAIFQNRRDSTYFSFDGGKHFYGLDEKLLYPLRWKVKWQQFWYGCDKKKKEKA